jgi:hypothetical protein
MLSATFHMSRMTIPHSVDSNKSHGEKCHCSSQEILYPNILLQNRHNFTFLHSFQTDHDGPETGGSRNFTTSNGGLLEAGVRLEIALKTEQRVHNGEAFTEHRAVDSVGLFWRESLNPERLHIRIRLARLIVQ